MGKEVDKKKTCFVITPIGDNNSEIRRHIDGIIDQAIIPALNEKYEVEVAHRKYEIGSINDRVIRSVYEADLVVANLTNLNPNVMFELAIRYSHGKPAIVIAEDGTKLPFDIIDENTVFYINDPFGANELKIRLIEFEKNIDFTKRTFGPVYKVISKLPLYDEVESGEDVSNDKMLKYIMERLDSIEYRVTNRTRRKFNFQVDVDYERGSIADPIKFQNDVNDILSFYDCYFYDKNMETGFVILFNEKMENAELKDFVIMLNGILKRHVLVEYLPFYHIKSKIVSYE